MAVKKKKSSKRKVTKKRTSKKKVARKVAKKKVTKKATKKVVKRKVAKKVSKKPARNSVKNSVKKVTRKVKSSSQLRRSRKRDSWAIVPLSSGFMLTSILGFLISAYYVYPQSLRFGFAFMLVFALMFISSLISMAKAPLTERDI